MKKRNSASAQAEKPVQEEISTAEQAGLESPASDEISLARARRQKARKTEEIQYGDQRFWGWVQMRLGESALQSLRGSGRERIPVRIQHLTGRQAKLQGEEDILVIPQTSLQAAKRAYSLLLRGRVGACVRTGKVLWVEPERKYQAFTDSDFESVISEMYERLGLEFDSKEKCYTAIHSAAEENPCDQIKDFLDQCAEDWDGSPRVESLFPYYFNCFEQNEYGRFVSLAFMLGAVARGYSAEKGSKVDTLPVLKGPQGSAKSSAIALLFGEDHFRDGLPSLKLGDKEAAAIAHGAWVVELPELSAFRRQGADETKAFFSALSDTWRAPYARCDITRYRRFVFIGTTNDDQYLTDKTGNRRYFPLTVIGDVRVGAIFEDRKQLWGEAVHLYRKHLCAMENWRKDKGKEEGKPKLDISERWWIEPSDKEVYNLWLQAIQERMFDPRSEELDEVFRRIEILKGDESLKEAEGTDTPAWKMRLKPWEVELLSKGLVTITSALKLVDSTSNEQPGGKVGKGFALSLQNRGYRSRRIKHYGSKITVWELAPTN